MAAGFITLVAGAVAVLALASTPQQQVSVGVLSAVGSALSGYVAASFLRIYDRAQEQLNFYFEAPLIESRLLEAERLAQKLKGSRREAMFTRMIEEIMVSARRGDTNAGVQTAAEAVRAPRRRFLHLR